MGDNLPNTIGRRVDDRLARQPHSADSLFRPEFELNWDPPATGGARDVRKGDCRDIGFARLSRSRRSKEAEILVLRHELGILCRQAAPPKLTRADRALLAALSGSLPRPAWAGFSVRPDALLRWHRQLVARRWTYARRRPGRPTPRLVAANADPAPRAREPTLGVPPHRRRAQGVAISVSATSVRKVLLEEGLQPAPEHAFLLARVPVSAGGQRARL